ncbi:tRNA uridine-5-carboxymethylaminomethyl(34) synthesis enzyme MnmG [Alkaliphilus oremlandii]|uniref:tRNA uridine 5-carboxymethylaminomethyl modification enzyme MnmG n=1 Tax=Alkaliphilus oremlandii (strain OhILAs) TaxID=350688 RepID=MNMG_ALKOO|nr:tRNA uridine-5-carboxymethylaminomethyl(34) synthesis enzyme MnmG [Alkaliphilus oremlandii]A8MKR8.1 RecName: Full=tRNA uridine 5-carboxymethylaminomethyl modification enzyme MnmG; AltName: Full=Glucose-inhibited division protein A [Alkaliphilus oremlandii OhILAs]ABW20400.1 glucose inhibited division protein A [Alkaliphilus oremlandii OhILAs]
MITYNGGNYDVVVVGAGHAGCEAALATARMGYSTMMLTMSLDAIAMLPCNPSIGGTGKGHLVREIDALGGEMGLNIDKTFIQSRMLNTAKGPAVHSLRAQADKTRYHIEMKKMLENEPNLHLLQGEVVDIIVEDNTVKGVVTKTGAIYYGKAVILATGVYLKSKIFMGEVNYESGPNGLFPALYLSEKLKALGCNMRRFKTGTPARIHKDSIDFSKVSVQIEDEEIVPFSFMNEALEKEQIPCWLTRTTEETHRIIKENLGRSAMYRGDIESTGPRYCPSIEDKIVRFSEKPSHQIFIEPEGAETKEMYIQGFSTSLPEEVQVQMVRSVIGLENAIIMRPAYAIEYDCIDPTQLKASLEVKHINNLFSAGQFNGSSGYEEAAAQGLMAGINAVLKIRGEDPFILDRSEAYIGVLIDDLVTKGTNEPYRMMTSRSEYRLVLRQDNADLRLTEKGYALGLVKEDRYERYLLKKEHIKNEMERLKTTNVSPTIANPVLERAESTPIKVGMSLYDLLKRPELTYENIKEIDGTRPQDLMKDAQFQCEVMIKYEGYIEKQLRQIDQFKKLENKKLREDIDYNEIDGLRIEARQKLNAIRPLSVGQASRISGVSPADISVLLIYLEQKRRKKGEVE